MRSEVIERCFTILAVETNAPEHALKGALHIISKHMFMRAATATWAHAASLITHLAALDRSETPAIQTLVSGYVCTCAHDHVWEGISIKA